MYPLKLIPAVKDYIWGGTKLKTDFGIKSDLEKVAEAWTLSCHKDGSNIIANGSDKGKTLAAWLEEKGFEVLGSKGKNLDSFPVLIKLIDAKDNLSVQVHPYDEYAQRVEHEQGKTEAWYVIDCEEGAELIYGFKKEISSQEFEERIMNNTLLDVVNSVPVKKGDLFFIESGTLHAIGKGILLAEVQQNSNSTYRVYDYGRVGADGKPRELHIKKAVDVTSCTPPTHPYGAKPVTEKGDGYEVTELVNCDIFKSYSVKIDSEYSDKCGEESFVSLLSLDGDFTFSCGETELSLNKGESIFIPANMGEYTVKGKGEILKVTL